MNYAYDSCLGIYRPAQGSTKIAIQGWQVIVTNPVVPTLIISAKMLTGLLRMTLPVAQSAQLEVR